MRVKENVRMRIETVKVSIIHDYIISGAYQGFVLKSSGVKQSERPRGTYRKRRQKRDTVSK